MIITEMNAFADLVIKVKNCGEMVRTRWYRGAADLTKFRIKVLALSAKHKQWMELVRKSGQYDDQELNAMANMAVDLLDEEEKRVRIMQTNPLKRLKQRAFPGQLMDIISAMETIVDAGPQHVTSRMEYADLVDRLSLYTLDRLPFGPDPKYVPIVESVTTVQRTLENPQGHSVVIVHGVPGIGKTSLVKYLGLYYQEHRKQVPASTFFADGVVYMRCGEGAYRNIANLALQMLESFGPRSTLQSGDLAQQRDEIFRSPSSLSKLRKKLFRQTVLVLLDDVWEQAVVESFVGLGEGVKYVITSQFENIWPDGKKIKLETPSMQEARKILAMYTEGLSSEGHLPNPIEDLIVQIIEDVKFHPLMLANIGLGIDESGAQNLEEWRALRDRMRSKPTQFDIHNRSDERPVLFQEAYTSAVAESMHRMVARLEEGEKSLLFLMCLFENGVTVPETAVKILWYRVEQGVGEERNRLDYINFRNRLRNKSLIEVDGGKNTTQQRFLSIHKLRTLCIQQTYALELKSMLLKLLSNIDDAILVAMYIAKDFWSVVAPTAQILLRNFQFNHADNLSPSGRCGIVSAFAGYLAHPLLDVATSILRQLWRGLHIYGDISPSISGEEDVMDLLKRARNQRNWGLENLVPLLDPCAMGSRAEQTRLCARKIILKFIIKEELDDKSAAQLIKLPHTTSSMFDTLADILSTDYWTSTFAFDHKYFSSIHGETTHSLITLLQDKSAPVETRRKVQGVLGGCEKEFWHPGILDHEDGETVLSTAKQLVECSVQNDTADSWCALAETCSASLLSKSILLLFMGRVPGFLERLLRFFRQSAEPHLTGEENNATLLACLLNFIIPLSRASSTQMIGALMWEGKVLDLLREIAFSGATNLDLAWRARGLLSILAFEPEKRARIFADRSNLARVLKTTLPPSAPLQSESVTIAGGESSPYRLTDCQFVLMLMSSILRQDRQYACQLVEESRERMASVCPDIKKRALHFQRKLIAHFCRARSCDGIQIIFYDIINICILVTLFYPAQESVQATISTSLSLYRKSHSALVRTDLEEECTWEMYRGRRTAYVVMKKYAEVLSETERIIWTYRNKAFPSAQAKWRLYRLRMDTVYLKAMMGSYGTAMEELNDLITQFEKEGNKGHRYAIVLAERGVLKRLAKGNLEESLKDLSCSLHILTRIFPTYSWGSLLCSRTIYRILTHQGFVRHLLGDDDGARSDGEASHRLARNIRRKDLFIFGIKLIELPSDYLNFVFLN